MAAFLTKVFDDKRLTSVVLIMWLVLIVGCFAHLGIMESDIVAFGPSEHTFFMGIAINSWYRWTWVAIFTFLTTAINDFVGDSIVPWIQNTVQDHKTLWIPYSKFTCWAITQAYAIYSCTMSIFAIYLLMSQLDFMIIRMIADSLVNAYTTYRFLHHKRTNPAKYAEWMRMAMQHDDSDDGDMEGEGRRLFSDPGNAHGLDELAMGESTLNDIDPGFESDRQSAEAENKEAREEAKDAEPGEKEARQVLETNAALMQGLTQAQKPDGPLESVSQALDTAEAIVGAVENALMPAQPRKKKR